MRNRRNLKQNSSENSQLGCVGLSIIILGALWSVLTFGFLVGMVYSPNRATDLALFPVESAKEVDRLRSQAQVLQKKSDTMGTAQQASNKTAPRSEVTQTVDSFEESRHKDQVELHQKVLEGKLKELNSELTRIQLEIQQKELEAKPKEVEVQQKEQEGEPKEVEVQQKELKGEPKEVEVQQKALEGKPKEVEVQQKELEGKPKEESVPEAESNTIKEKTVEGRNSLDSSVYKSCEMKLLEADHVSYERDFVKTPIQIQDPERPQRQMQGCAVGCHFYKVTPGYMDAEFVHDPRSGSRGLKILRTMESVFNYPHAGVKAAKNNGYDIVMNTHLDSDVPMGYFSWVEYGIMDKPQPKTQSAAAAAFISNCDAKNGRLMVLDRLMSAGVRIDSYGKCRNNRQEGPDRNKQRLLKEYKFTLAFENSEEEDYVTEKYFQALVAGSVPVVLGAPNIHDYEPAPNSLIHIQNLDQVSAASKKIQYLMENATAYEEMLAWKETGPTDKFLALVDMASTHSHCRLCVLIASKLREKELLEKPQRMCQCNNEEGVGTLYHVYVRERGDFEYNDIFLDSSSPDLLKDLKEKIYETFGFDFNPKWYKERPPWQKGERKYSIYRIYPTGKTQREALYADGFFRSDSDIRNYVIQNMCPKIEVVFV